MSDHKAADLARNLHMLAALTRELLESDVSVGTNSASFTQVVVLKWLDTAAPRKSGDVARFLSASAPAATQILARLQRKGLVRTRPNPADARAADLYVTPRGRALVRRHEEEKFERLERLLADTTPARRTALVAGLEGAIELLLKADEHAIDLCLHCGAHASPFCVMRRHGRSCPTEPGLGRAPKHSTSRSPDSE